MGEYKRISSGNSYTLADRLTDQVLSLDLKHLSKRQSKTIHDIRKIAMYGAYTPDASVRLCPPVDRSTLSAGVLFAGEVA